MEQRKDQRIMYFRFTDILNMTILDLLMLLSNIARKKQEKGSLLLTRMLASYTLKGCTGMHFRVF